MSNIVLDVQNVSLAFNGLPVLNRAIFSLESGSFLGIIGPNGAGKSTLLKLIAGLLHPDNGSISVDNKSLTSYSRTELARSVGYVPQNVDLNFPFTVYEVVKMGRYAHHPGMFSIDPRGRDAVFAALKWMDLLDIKDRSYMQLSGGEKQRAIIASALAQEPFLLLLDEPTSALDLKHQQSIYKMLRKLTEMEQMTILIVTHDINLAAQFCSRLILLNRGDIVRDGLPDDVLKFPVIQEVYGVKVYIDVNPFTDSLYILPYDTQTDTVVVNEKREKDIRR